MFCDKMTGARVQTSRNKAGHQEVNKGSVSECSNEEDVKGDMCEGVVGVPFRRCSIPYKAWPESVTKYLE
jgi:hypothetical protein